MTGYQRQYSIQRWANGSFRFEHESILEDFIWDNLNILFKANPLRRQHHINGNYCDILAIGKRGNLIIIELKNDEDRYVVQQITRYYHQLIQEKPYPDLKEYQNPTHGSLEYLDFFVSVALDLWKERLESLESKVK